MTINLFQTPEYKALMQEHIANTIGYLFAKNQEFAIACDVRHITFDPELPGDILEGFKETVLFVLSGYTFETATLEGEYFSFEAGFGEENFGSVVTMPLLAIKQVIVGEHPIVLNLAHPTPKAELSKQSSMEALLRNPENKKLLKKKKL
jgi:hypothetical protein